MTVAGVHGAKKTKKGRKAGRQTRKLGRQGRTAWGLIQNAKVRKQLRVVKLAERFKRRGAKRICRHCGMKGFSDRRTLLRHEHYEILKRKGGSRSNVAEAGSGLS